MKKRITVLMLACTIASVAVGVVGCNGKSDTSGAIVSTGENEAVDFSADGEMTDGSAAQAADESMNGADETAGAEPAGDTGTAGTKSEDAAVLSGGYSVYSADTGASAWSDVELTYTFYEDGTFEFSDDGGSTCVYSGTYTVEGDKVNFTVLTLDGEEADESELESENILIEEMIIDGDKLKTDNFIWEKE